MLSLSVCAETIFPALSFRERAENITRQGFGIEFWHRPEDEVRFLEATPDIKVTTFVGCDEGSMVHPDGVEAFLAGIERGIGIAKRLRCKNLILVTGEIGATGAAVHAIASHPVTRWVTAYKTLCRVAELAEKHDLTYNLENLNTKVNHADYPLPHVQDVVSLIEEVGSPRLRLLLDIYHAQVEDGNIVDTIKKHVRHVGHIHVADVPGRHEPGTGEINFSAVVKALHEVHYDGTLGMEALPVGDGNDAMRRFREIFEK